jgi:hypothetical protein
MLKPWREIAVPHKSVLNGKFQQAEFAADISAVRKGEAPEEYQNARLFFERTFITEGMRLLLTQVAQRLSGVNGEPVIQLQTAFGGGKTHTMLAVYHLAKRECGLSDLNGVSTLIERAGLIDVPQARIAVLDGTDMSPAQAARYSGIPVHTLWGELAWQLGGMEAYERVKEADVAGVSPGKEVLKKLLQDYSPCVVLIDELVAYIRQFKGDKEYSGGSYNSNLSFVQSLTEAAKLAPQAIVLASLPESEVEAGDVHGVAALKALEKTFGRVQAIWKPVETEEAFEIVRRRLFEPIKNEQTRANVCRAFADLYKKEGASLPGEAQESHYFDRLLQAYPIHPETFDRLYEDWTTIDGFQRTRGVLKLMAKVIYRLWRDDNKDLMIMPGSLPLLDTDTRSELASYLPNGWDPVIEKDIDGERSETCFLENQEPRFGAINAATRVARTLFLGTAPSSVGDTATMRGLDRARILLGCLQPEQTGSIYGDALSRLTDRLHYLNSTGERNQNTERFWFDTRANLRREMEDRKRRLDNPVEIQTQIANAVKSMLGRSAVFQGVHVFTSDGDIPDDEALRLVVLPPECWYTKQETREAFGRLQAILKSHGNGPRYKTNRLIFLAPDQQVVGRIIDTVQTFLAWKSIVDDIDSGRLNIDRVQEKQAKKELDSVDRALPRLAQECFKWLLCPFQDDGKADMKIEAFMVQSAGSSVIDGIERLCEENELVIKEWSPIHLRSQLRNYYWRDSQPAQALKFWEDSLRYLYLPRLQNKSVLSQAIAGGLNSRDFFAIAYGQNEAKFEGFQFGSGSGSVQLDESLLLIDPETATAYDDKLKQEEAKRLAELNKGEDGRNVTGAILGSYMGQTSDSIVRADSVSVQDISHTRSVLYIGTVNISPAGCKMQLMNLADELIQHLSLDPDAEISIRVEIQANFPNGVDDGLKRTVNENARHLKLSLSQWE